ncbi:MAG: tetratricopeptide repeat protein [Ignavibacteriaceae bacterium]|nr:tetratricopeptide repeat protein [Ignavibacteriaceae bacterium]
MQKIAYNKFEHKLNKYLKEYLSDDSYDHLKERLDLPEKQADLVSEKINEFYREQLQIDKNPSRDRIRIDRIITFSEKSLPQEKFCKLLVDLGRICLSEGKIDLSNEIFRKANKLTNNDHTKAESLLGLADVLSRKAKWTKSMETIYEAKALFKSIPDYRGLAKCENLLGTIFGELGDILKAKKHLLTSLSLIKSDEDLELAANLYSNLGIVYSIQESPQASISHLNRALAIYNKLGNNKSASEVSLNLGIVHYESDNYDAAMAALNTAIETSKAGRFLSILCLTYLAKAQVLIKLDDFYYASEFANKALEISHNSDDKLTLADIYKVKGIIERHLENFAASETYLLNSLRINENLNNELNVAETSFELRLLYEKMKDADSKNIYLKRSRNYFRNIEANAKVDIIEELLEFSPAI